MWIGFGFDLVLVLVLVPDWKEGAIFVLWHSFLSLGGSKPYPEGWETEEASLISRVVLSLGVGGRMHRPNVSGAGCMMSVDN